MKTDIATTDLERQGRNVDAASPSPAPTLFEVARRGGIWEVTKDGRFYGHYLSQQPAFGAVDGAAHAVVASGGSADILLRGERPWQTASRRSGSVLELFRWIARKCQAENSEGLRERTHTNHGKGLGKLSRIIS